jgi:hypothetical protein
MQAVECGDAHTRNSCLNVYETLAFQDTKHKWKQAEQQANSSSNETVAYEKRTAAANFGVISHIMLQTVYISYLVYQKNIKCWSCENERLKHAS